MNISELPRRAGGTARGCACVLALGLALTSLASQADDDFRGFHPNYSLTGDMRASGAGNALLDAGRWQLGGYLDRGLRSMAVEPAPLRRDSAADLLPTFRMQHAEALAFGLRPYFEAAIRVDLGSESEPLTDPTTFRVDDQLGIGFRFGDNQDYELGYRYQHLSNGEDSSAQDGFGQHMLRFSWEY